MNKTNKFSPEVRERAARMVQEHRWEYPSLCAAVESIAPKIDCVPHTLLEWVKREEVDGAQREGLTTSERERIKALESEVKELRRANDILKKASAFFAQSELDRRLNVHLVTFVSAVLTCVLVSSRTLLKLFDRYCRPQRVPASAPAGFAPGRAPAD